MSNKEHGTRGRYKDGCRCDECKCAESGYQRELKQRKQAADTRGGNSGVKQVRLAAVPSNPATSGNTAVHVYARASESAGGTAEAAVREEISSLTNPRPGLVAVAVEMARVLDDPRATTSKAPAAGRLVEVLERLRKGADTRKSKLASVRAMTSPNS